MKAITVLKSHEDAIEIVSEMQGIYQHHLEGATVVCGTHSEHGDVVVHVALFGESYLVKG